MKHHQNTISAILSSLAVATIAIATMTTDAQAQTFEWYDGLCDFTGEFDNTKYSAEQIENSHYVLDHLTQVNLTSFSSPQFVRDLDKVSWADMDELKKEYRQYRAKVAKLKVVPAAQEYKRELIKDVEREYVHDKLTLLAYLNPKKALELSPPMCKQYIEPFFQGSHAIQNKWRQKVRDDIAKQVHLGNDPYRKIAIDQYNEQKRTNPSAYARISLLTYGFGNCVIEAMPSSDPDKVFRDFQKLNKTLFGDSMTMECEMP